MTVLGFLYEMQQYYSNANFQNILLTVLKF